MITTCPILACPNARPRSIVAALRASIMRRDTCDRGTSASLFLPTDMLVRKVRTAASPSVEHTTCDTGDDSSEAFLVRWRSGECGRYLVRIFP